MVFPFSLFNKKESNQITQPIQLLGASLVGSVFLVGEFIYASIITKGLMSWFYCITAILIFPIILWFIYRLQTRFRNELQSDPYYNASQRLKQYTQESNKAKEINLGELKHVSNSNKSHK